VAVIFSKIDAEISGTAEAVASIFDKDIWKKNHISLSSLS